MAKNIAASVRQRLLDRSRREKLAFDELAQFYGMERFLYRLSKSSYADKFLLKGALMFKAWASPVRRPTKDIDLLGFIRSNINTVVETIKNVCSTEVENDGIVFDLPSITGEFITFDSEYKGIRVKMFYHLGSARYKMQIDIGIGDNVFPPPSKIKFPAMLEFPAPELLGYKMETSIAEKVNAMITLRELNSRMKDFYDIWLLADLFNFEGSTLAEAIRRTQKNRDSVIPSKMAAFSESYIAERQDAWNAFIEKINPEKSPGSFAEAIEFVRAFLEPVLDAIRNNSDFTKTWLAPGPWE